MSTDVVAATKHEALRAARADLEAKPDGVLESIADRYGLSFHDVLTLLPKPQVTEADGTRFDEIWTELGSWGDVLFIIHNEHGVFEIKTALAPGSRSNGYFNVHGEAALGGHLRAERCAAICLIDRPFFGRRSCSIQFLDADGASMFKVFVRRTPERELDADQLERFEALKRRIGTDAAR